MHKTLPLFALPFLLLSPTLVTLPGVPVLEVTNLTEGMTATFEVSNCAPGDTVLLAASLLGPGPMATPFGLADLTPPLRQSPFLTANAAGIVVMQKALPMGTSGVPIWLQAANITSGLLSNSLAEVIAPLQPPVEIVFVLGGGFGMGDHMGMGAADELPVHSVRVSDFWMDKFEVTNESYAQYLNDALSLGEVVVTNNVVYQVGGAAAALCDTTGATPESRITWDGTTFGITVGKEDHPMARVSWHGACTYANWRSLKIGRTPCYDLTTWYCDFNADGCRLPTEAEREFAILGGLITYSTYPWGYTFNGSQANCFASGDPYDNGTTPVGYYDGNQVPPGVDMANGYGLYDTAGNMFEWCQDWYSATYYFQSSYLDPHGPNTGTARVMRGGSWNSGSYYLRSACRSYSTPYSRNAGIGFRLVEVHP